MLLLDGKDNRKSSVLCNPLLISGSSSYSSAANAFIFSLHNTNGYDPVKFSQYQHLNKTMYSCTSYGPTFGGNLGQHNIYTPNDAVNTQTAFTYCGSTYSLLPGNSVGYCAFFAGESKFTPTDIVFCICRRRKLSKIGTGGCNSGFTIRFRVCRLDRKLVRTRRCFDVFGQFAVVPGCFLRSDR